MSKDPLGLDPIPAIQEVTNPGGARALQALKAGLVTQEVTIVPKRPDETLSLEERIRLTLAMQQAPVLGPNGQLLTLEERQRIAASRGIPTDETDFRYAGDVAATPIGVAAKKIIDAQPMYRIHPTEVLPKEEG